MKKILALAKATLDVSILEYSLLDQHFTVLAW